MSKRCQNTYENSESYLHISDVLLYVTFFGTTSSSASFEWTAVFFWELIGAARVDGRISKVTKRARCSKAEPEGEKSLRGLKSLQLWYVIMPGYRQTEINKRLGKKLQIWDHEIMTTKGCNNLCVGRRGGGGWEGGKGGRGEGRRYIMVFQDNSLPMNCQRRGRGGVEGGVIRIFRSLMLVGGGGGRKLGKC